MNTTPGFDAETVQLMLASGDSAQINDALQQIDTHLQRPLCGGLREVGLPVSAHDLPIVWSETLTAIWKAVQAGTVDLDQKLAPWIFTILKRRAIDCLRAKSSRKSNADEHAEFEMREAVRRQEPAWTDAEFEESVQVAVGSFDELPPRQRVVMKVYHSGRPATEEMKILCEEVSKVTGRVETVVAVTRALQEARLTIKESLTKRGILRRSSRD